MKGFRRRAPFGTFFQNIQKSPGKGDSPLSDGTVPLAVPSHLQYHCSFHLHYTSLYWIFHTGILIAYLEKETKNPGGSMDFYIFWGYNYDTCEIEFFAMYYLRRNKKWQEK